MSANAPLYFFLGILVAVVLGSATYTIRCAINTSRNGPHIFRLYWKGSNYCREGDGVPFVCVERLWHYFKCPIAIAPPQIQLRLSKTSTLDSLRVVVDEVVPQMINIYSDQFPDYFRQELVHGTLHHAIKALGGSVYLSIFTNNGQRVATPAVAYNWRAEVVK